MNTVEAQISISATDKDPISQRKMSLFKMCSFFWSSLCVSLFLSLFFSQCLCVFLCITASVCLSQSLPEIVSCVLYSVVRMSSLGSRLYLQSWKKMYRHLGSSLINSPSIYQNIKLTMLGSSLMFLPDR